MNDPAGRPEAAPGGHAVGPPDRCPRCGGGFQCGMAGPGPCACTTVTLPPPMLAALTARYRGCLCVACLQALAAGAPIDTTEPADATARPPTDRPAAA